MDGYHWLITDINLLRLKLSIRVLLISNCLNFEPYGSLYYMIKAATTFS